MIGGDVLRFFSSRSDERPSWSGGCLAKQPTGALVDSGESLLIERRIFQAGKGEMMVDIAFHSLPVDRLEVRPGNAREARGMAVR